MRMEKRNISRTEDIRQCVLLWKMFGVCVVLLVCIIGKRNNVQAAEYDYPIEETKVVQVLNEDYRDSQGIKYTLDDEHGTAMIGNYADGYTDSSGYQETEDGVCIIPEKVSYQGKEYTVTTMDQEVFTNNETIRVLVIPDTITETKSNLIWSNMQAQYLYVGKGLDLTQCSMENCSNLREVAVSGDNPYVKNVDGVIYSKDGKTLLYNPPMREGSALGEYQVLDGTETIASQAFRESRYRSIRLPDSVKRIGFETFAFCAWLRTMDLSNVEEIGACPFYGGDYSLQAIQLPKRDYTLRLHTMDQYVPMRALMLTKGLHLEDKNSSSFEEMKYLQCAAVQDGVTAIGEKEFQKCGRLQMVLLPDTIQSIPEKCFSKCTSLKKLYIPPSVTSIGDGVLADCSAVIYGEEGSVAEDYALENGFSFVDVSSHDHEHLADTTVYEDPYMKITAKYCSECGYAKDIQQEMKNTDPDADITNGVYDMHLEKTHEKVVLERNMTDEQGVVYSINKQTHIASVVRVEDREEQTDIVIPEVIEKDGAEYIVDHVKENAFASNEHVVAITLSDAIRTVDEGALAAKSLKYVYIGENMTNMIANAFAHDNNIRNIWIKSENPHFYVKDHTVYEYNSDGGKDYWVFTYTPDNNTSAEDTKKDEEIKDPGKADQDASTGEIQSTETTEKSTETGTDTGNQGASDNSNDSSKDVNSEKVKSSSKGNNKTSLSKPKLTVKKKQTSNGVHYLQLNLKKLSGKYIELYVQKGKGRYKKIKLRSNRIKKKSMQLKIGYKPDGKKIRVKVRTYTKKKGKKKYSAWSKVIVVT